MLIDFNGLAATATQLLGDAGQKVTWSRTEGGTFDPVTGQTTGATTKSYSSHGPLVDFDTSLINGESILRTDKKLILDPAGDVPQVDDVITTLEGDFTVMNVNKIAPNGTVVSYVVQLRS